MNRLIKIILLFYFLGCLFARNTVAQTPTPNPYAEVIKQGSKKVIKAIDLKVQREQNKTIHLQNIQKALENTLSKIKLKEIAQWIQRQRDLYKKYYDQLWKVRNTIKTFKRVQQIVSRQQQLVAEYKFTWHMIKQDHHFTPDELDYMYHVYTGIFNESLFNLDQLILIVNSFKTQMTDGKRLEILNRTSVMMDQNYTDLVRFNRQNIGLSLRRSKDEAEIEAVRKLYGI